MKERQQYYYNFLQKNPRIESFTDRGVDEYFGYLI